MKLHNTKRLKVRRRSLRNNQTNAEKELWTLLRRSQLGYKFRRQQSIGPYIVDFYCPELKLVVEVDGSVHGEDVQRKKDLIRSAFLAEHGLRIIRYRNDQVLGEIDSIRVDLQFKLAKLVDSSPPFQGGD